MPLERCADEPEIAQVLRRGGLLLASRTQQTTGHGRYLHRHTGRRPGSAKPDTNLTAELSGAMMPYDWKINGRNFTDTLPLLIQQGQRATLTFNNTTTMWHPMHLHGHTFQVIKPDGSPGPRKDTAIVLPKQTVSVTLIADNPGIWMMHCHNTYHQEAGMMTSLNYTT
jgi:FtsP/CotA-like multicopper oxidase with cupredoxin domain